MTTAIPTIVAPYMPSTLSCISDAWVRIQPCMVFKAHFSEEEVKQLSNCWKSEAKEWSHDWNPGLSGFPILLFSQHRGLLQGRNTLLPWWFLAPGYLLSDSLCDPWHQLGHRMGRWPMFSQAWLRPRQPLHGGQRSWILALKAASLHNPHSILLSLGFS